MGMREPQIQVITLSVSQLKEMLADAATQAVEKYRHDNPPTPIGGKFAEKFLLDTSEVAEFLMCSRQTVCEYAAKGWLKRRYIGDADNPGVPPTPGARPYFFFPEVLAALVPESIPDGRRKVVKRQRQ